MYVFLFLCRIKSLKCTLQLGGNLLRATLKQLNSSVTALTGKDHCAFIYHQILVKNIDRI